MKLCGDVFWCILMDLYDFRIYGAFAEQGTNQLNEEKGIQGFKKKFVFFKENKSRDVILH